MTTPATFTYDYTKAQTPGISVSQLDMLANSIFSASPVTGWPGMVWAGIKLVVAVAYVWARAKMIEQQMLLEKQQYEVAHTNANQSEIDGQEPPHIAH